MLNDVSVKKLELDLLKHFEKEESGESVRNSESMRSSFARMS